MGFYLILLLFFSKFAFALETEDILFHCSFEEEIKAEIAKGNPIGKQMGKVFYTEGKKGKGIVVGEGKVKFFAEKNIWPEKGTIEIWAKPLDWRGDDRKVHSFFSLKKLKLQKTRYNQLSFSIRGEGIEGVGNSEGITTIETKCFWSKDTWHQIVATWNEDEMKLYIDGKLRYTRKGVDVPQFWESKEFCKSKEFCIGGEIPEENHTVIDELYIYKRALSEKEIKETYRGKHKNIPSPGVKIRTDYLPFEKLIKVKVDIGGLRNLHKEVSCLLEVYQKGNKKIFLKGKIEKFRKEIGRISFDISKLPLGEYRLVCSILDKNGKLLSQEETSFIKETNLTWKEVEKIGVSDKVPPPWTPLRVNKTSIECWGRSYKFGKFALPEQIIIKGEKILASPISFFLDIPVRFAGGELLSWEKGETKIISKKRDKIELRSKARISFLSHLELEVNTSVEYDGFMKVDVELTPLQPTHINNFTLEIPIESENGKYFWARPGNYFHPFTSGELPKKEGRVWKGRFLPFIWIGDEDRGIAWYCESDKNWIVKKASRVIEIRREENIVKLLIHFIDTPSILDSPFRTTFALQATPVRPMPSGWRNWHLIGEKKPGHIWYLWWSVYAGVNGVVAHSYPRPRNPNEFKKIVEDYHKKGVKVIPYLAISEMGINTPEGRFYANEWMRLPFYRMADRTGKFACSAIHVCPNSHWVDFVVWAVNEMVEKYDIDGMYLDNFFPRGCHNFKHGCGYIDKKGRMKDTYPIFRIRELMKRLRIVFLEHNKKPFLMTTSKPYPCFIGDLCGHGEGNTEVNIPDDEAQKRQLGRIKAQFMGRQWGIPLFLLPQLKHGYVRDEDRTSLSEYLLAQFLPHDILIWPAYIDVRILKERWEKIRENFGMDGVKFLPYWEKPPIISNLPDLVISSAWVKPKKALLIVSNLSKKFFSQKVKVDLKRLGLSEENTRVYDATYWHRSYEVPMKEKTIELSIKPRNFKVFILEEK